MIAVRGSRTETTVNAVWRLIVRLTLIGLVLYACYRLRNVFTTLFVAAIIGYVLDPVVEWLARNAVFANLHNGFANLSTRLASNYRRILHPYAELSDAPVKLKRHALRVYATLYVFVMAVFVLWQGTVLVVKPFVAEFQQATSPEGRRQAMEHKERLLKWYNTTAPEWAQSDKIQMQIRSSDLSKSISHMAAQVGEKVLESLKNIVEIVLLPVLAFYFIIDGHKLKREFIALVPRRRLKETLRMITAFNRIMRAFVGGQFILCVLAGVIVGAGLAMLHVKYPVILGVLAGITRAIPIIGPIIGGIPIILLTFASKGMGTALAVLGFFTFLHFAESKFIMPMLIGDRMELHPVIIIVVLLIGGELGGILIGGQIGALLGMFFSAPVASLIRVMIRRYWLHLRTRGSHTPPPAHRSLLSQPAASLSEAVD